MAKVSTAPTANTITANDDFLITRYSVNSANTYRVKTTAVMNYIDTRGSANLGIVSSGNVSLSANNGPLQYLTCNGAFTLISPNTDCKIDLVLVNGNNAGAITFSGFQKELTGDAYATTANNSYFVEITRIKSISVYKVNDLQ